MKLDVTDQVERFKEFIETYYKETIHDLVRDGGSTIVIDFMELSKHDIELSELLLDEPEEVLKAAEIATEQMDVPVKLKVRFYNLPKSQNIRIKDIRST